jgi:hypothetical protein
MTRRFCLLLALVAAPLASGCLVKTTTHRLYLSPHGALTWSVLEQDIRSSASNDGDRATEEATFLQGVASGSHPVLEALRRLAPYHTSLRLLRSERPYTIVTEARFERIDVAALKLFAELGIAGTASLQRTGAEWTLIVALDFTAVGDELDTPVTALIEEFDRYRLILTEGRFVAATGFTIVDDGAAVELNVAQVPTDRPELRLTWR